jgi:predicted metalloprotease with PDZ domain
MTLSFVSDGDWAFTDGEALELAGKVLKAHHEVIGSMPSKQAALILFPFPQNAAASKWSAETRGSTVTLLMGKLPSKVAALAQLSTPLTHELFHLWVPNALALEGNYDWFYEGFTIYQAARTAVRLNLLTFQEFLNAMGRAYDGYASGVDRDRWSLIEASKRRWTVGESVVYQKSMLIAFLYDLKLRSESHGKHSLDDVYRDIFRQSRSLAGNPGDGGSLRGQGTDGNDAAISALVRASGTQDFAQAFIQRAATIDLPAELDPLGLRVERLGLRTHLSVNESLTRRQRDLLRELGYNDYVRSSTQKRRS